MILHPWHKAPTGFQAPYLINALVEISTGMRTKYEVDKESGLLKLDRILYSSIQYPANYGFIPQTLAADLDPLDIMILCREPILPMCLVPARIIGVMRMIDQGKVDDKILAVPMHDAATSRMQDVEDIDFTFKVELKEFFESYTRLENKLVSVPDFQGREQACSIIEEAMHYYNEVYR